jgi:signal-transduction protein with cAMP-binding, CBS, and nucleotidyltransferase domain
MEQIRMVMKRMIDISDGELNDFLDQTITRTFRKNEILSRPDSTPNEIFFINEGLVRVLLTDSEGVEHTIHFALENQFIADYSCFIQKIPSIYMLQAVEETEVVVLPRSAINWGYQHLKDGQKLGRLIAEFYFIYQDNRIQDRYVRMPKQRYDSISEVFPNIHNRVPQHMIASYLGISSVHLSRHKNGKT